MPETAIDKDCDFGDAKNEIWRTRQSCSATPAGDPMIPKQANESLFGACVRIASH